MTKGISIPLIVPTLIYLIVYIYLLYVKAHLCKHTDAITETDFDFPKYVSVVYDCCTKGSPARGNNEIHNHQILRRMLLCPIVNMFFQLDSMNAKHIYAIGHFMPSL